MRSTARTWNIKTCWRFIIKETEINIHMEYHSLLSSGVQSNKLCLSLLSQQCPSSSPCCWPVWIAVVTPGSTCASLDTCSMTWSRTFYAVRHFTWSPLSAAVIWITTRAARATTPLTSWRAPAAKEALPRHHPHKYWHFSHMRTGHRPIQIGTMMCTDGCKHIERSLMKLTIRWKLWPNCCDYFLDRKKDHHQDEERVTVMSQQMACYHKCSQENVWLRIKIGLHFGFQ